MGFNNKITFAQCLNINSKESMKILKRLSFVPAIALAVACNSSAPTESVEATEAEEVEAVEVETVEYAVNTEGDEVSWVGYKTFTEDAHNGTLQVSEGNFAVEGDKIVGGSFSIDMNTIHSIDMAEMEEYYQKLVGHLKSPDFFDVATYPSASFVITEVKEATNDTTGATHHVSGNLTIKDVTKNITIPATVSMEGGAVSFATPEFVIDRTQWGVQYGSSSFVDLAKDNIIDNNIKLKVNLKANKA